MTGVARLPNRPLARWPIMSPRCRATLTGTGAWTCSCVILNSSTFIDQFWRNDGAGNFTYINLPANPYETAATNASFVGAGDFNGDGKLDVLGFTPTGTSGGAIWVMTNDGAGNLTLGPVTNCKHQRRLRNI